MQTAALFLDIIIWYESFVCITVLMGLKCKLVKSLTISFSSHLAVGKNWCVFLHFISLNNWRALRERKRPQVQSALCQNIKKLNQPLTYQDMDMGALKVFCVTWNQGVSSGSFLSCGAGVRSLFHSRFHHMNAQIGWGLGSLKVRLKPWALHPVLWAIPEWYLWCGGTHFPAGEGWHCQGVYLIYNNV